MWKMLANRLSVYAEAGGEWDITITQQLKALVSAVAIAADICACCLLNAELLLNCCQLKYELLVLNSEDCLFRIFLAPAPFRRYELKNLCVGVPHKGSDCRFHITWSCCRGCIVRGE
jgi:hypothetical protein